MELIVILLSSISGALIGTSVGIYLLYRKLRPITGAELDLTRGKLRSTEFSLASATANVDNFKKQLEEREQLFAAAEEKSRALETEAAALRQKMAEQNEVARVNDETRAIAESASRQLAALEAQIEAGDRKIKDLSGQLERLTLELGEASAHLAEETQGRTSLETQLSAEHDHSRRLASRISELESERSHFDLTLSEERQSAAKGIELLLMAQENLARIFRPAAPQVVVEPKGRLETGLQPETNGHTEINGHAALVEAVAAGGPLE